MRGIGYFCNIQIALRYFIMTAYLAQIEPIYEVNKRVYWLPQEGMPHDVRSALTLSKHVDKL